MTSPARRRRRRSRGLGIVAWGLVAGVVALGQVLDGGDEATEEVPPIVAEDPEHAPVEVVAAPPAAPAAPAPAAAAPAPAPTAAPAPAPAPAHKVLPQPFLGMRTFATPLITPRLRLPRVLTPHLAGISSLLVRARPGEPVAVTLTAYCLQGNTRRGLPVRPGIIAADPRIFPLARHVELFAGGRYLGRFLVDDTGGKVRGRRIDIWTPDCDDARRFGRRDGVATLVARE